RYGEAENGLRRVLAVARRGAGLDQRNREVDHRTRFMGKGGGAEAAYLDKAGNGFGRFGDEAAAAGREPDPVVGDEACETEAGMKTIEKGEGERRLARA